MGDDFSVKWQKFPVASGFRPVRQDSGNYLMLPGYDLIPGKLMNQLRVKTPCIGICSTTSVGDRICRGCKRFAIEVIDWNSYTDAEKQAVLDRVESLIKPIVETRFIIRSTTKLAAGLRQWAVPYNTSMSPASWLHNLLKKRHRELRDLSEQGLFELGVEIRAEWQHLDLAALAEDMDQQLLRLCEAHQIRYFSHIPD
jgi:uncharacterized protein